MQQVGASERNSLGSHFMSCKDSIDTIKDKTHVELDGNSLEIADVVAIARYSVPVVINQADSIIHGMKRSIEVLNKHLEEKDTIYGVNTGVGGNADTRTNEFEELQLAALQHQQSGILTNGAKFHGQSSETESLSIEVVKAIMVIRCNTFLKGCSAVELNIVELLIEAVNNDIVPLVPQRGSVSASGDLSTLSYIAGFLEGNPDIFAHTPKGLKSSPDALQMLGREPVRLKAKEALAIINGTAPSAAVALLALYDTNNLAVTVQVLTAMATEALLGTRTNFDSFISSCRPHSGQVEVAQNLLSFLSNGKFADSGSSMLAQDRYALRTAPQWIGPQLEDLQLAGKQLSTEINSVTDNPLVDVQRDRVISGGNFQAATVSSAMEKTRHAITMLGRLLLAQCNEIVNASMSKGLTPNCCFDEPSTSFTLKGVDINMTAYYSELAFLANSVSSHVHTADVGNQSVNSVALIGARYTAKSVELLAMMSAAEIYVLCQALDLRAFNAEFFENIQGPLHDTILRTFPNESGVNEKICDVVKQSWLGQTHLDKKDRCASTSSNVVSKVMEMIDSTDLAALQSFRENLDRLLGDKLDKTKSAFIASPSTQGYLGDKTSAIYGFVRNQLAIPLNQGIKDHPTLSADESQLSIGSYISKIYKAIRNDELMGTICEASTETTKK